MLANNRYFSSALSIKGRKETIAKIPIKVEEKMFFKIILYSSNFKGNIVEIMFPVYPKEISGQLLKRKIKEQCPQALLLFYWISKLPQNRKNALCRDSRSHID